MKKAFCPSAVMSVAAILIQLPGSVLAQDHGPIDRYHISSFEQTIDGHTLAGTVLSRGSSITTEMLLKNHTECAVIARQVLIAPDQQMYEPVHTDVLKKKDEGSGVRLGFGFGFGSKPSVDDDERATPGLQVRVIPRLGRAEEGKETLGKGTHVRAEFRVPVVDSFSNWKLETAVSNTCKNTNVVFTLVSAGPRFFQVPTSQWNCDELTSRLSAAQKELKETNCAELQRKVAQAKKALEEARSQLNRNKEDFERVRKAYESATDTRDTVERNLIQKKEAFRTAFADCIGNDPLITLDAPAKDEEDKWGVRGYHAGITIRYYHGADSYQDARKRKEVEDCLEQASKGGLNFDLFNADQSLRKANDSLQPKRVAYERHKYSFDALQAQYDAAEKAYEGLLQQRNTCEKKREDLTAEIASLQESIRKCHELRQRAQKVLKETAKIRDARARVPRDDLEQAAGTAMTTISQATSAGGCPEASSALSDGLNSKAQAEELGQDVARLSDHAKDLADQGAVEEAERLTGQAQEKLNELHRKMAEARNFLRRSDDLARQCAERRRNEARSKEAQEKAREAAIQRNRKLLQLIEDLGLIDGSKIREENFQGVWSWLPEALEAPLGTAAEEVVHAPIPTDAIPAIGEAYKFLISYLDPCTSDGAMNTIRRLQEKKRYRFEDAVQTTLELCRLMQRMRQQLSQSGGR
jgi:hypothetical protein